MELQYKMSEGCDEFLDQGCSQTPVCATKLCKYWQTSSRILTPCGNCSSRWALKPR